MKKLLLVLMLVALPSVASALEQSFTQQGLKASIKLSPEKLETQSDVQLTLSLSKEGANIAERDVTLEVYEHNVDQPIMVRKVDVLDSEYVDSWKFEKAGDYRVVIKIADQQKPDDLIRYEVNATVMEAGEHENHGMFMHHFGGGKWGWWGSGLMLLMMGTMMILVL